jgi:hypothetical protein
MRAMKLMDKEKEILPLFTEVLKSRMAEKRLGVHHLEKSTGITKAHLEALVKGNFETLPAAPYVRGYLKQIAPVVEVDEDELWKLYQAEATSKMSGATDQLPGNRFAFPKKKTKRFVIIGIVVLLMGSYLFFNRGQLLGEPMFVLLGDNEATMTTQEAAVTFRGSIDPNDTLLINDLIVEINTRGEFEESYPLEFGVNTFTFRAKRFLGKEKEILRRVVRSTATSTLEEDEINL